MSSLHNYQSAARKVRELLRAAARDAIVTTAADIRTMRHLVSEFDLTEDQAKAFIRANADDMIGDVGRL